MNAAILKGLHRLPNELDLVVGIPRSGLLAANLVSLAANIPMTDLDGFIAGRVLSSGSTKRASAVSRSISEMRKILVIDDSINNGDAMRTARVKIAASGRIGELTFAAVYGSQRHHRDSDMVLEVVPQPRMFQWNFMHHIFLEQSCVDIDGVLCRDPTNEENDDGSTYEHFLRRTQPLYRPSRRIGYLVTSRLERYRSLTQAWLARHRIQYGKLIMLDLPSKKERQRQSAHSRFKADFYRISDAILFIESEKNQATSIAKLAGKPVLCTQTQEIILPTSKPSGVTSGKLSGLLANWMKPIALEASQLNVVGYKATEDDVPDVSYVLVDPDDQSKPRTLISYLGPTADNVTEVIESVRQACLLRSEFPVVVLSEFHHDLMAICGAPIEFLPELRHVPTLKPDEYARYVNRRWALILEKWEIRQEVTLASSVDEFLTEQIRRT